MRLTTSNIARLFPFRRRDGLVIEPDEPIGYITDYNVFGNSVQTGTPTPTSPALINSVGQLEGGVIILTTGAVTHTTTQIQLTSPLKSLLNGARDDLFTSNIVEMVLDGTEHWGNVLVGTNSPDFYYAYGNAVDALAKSYPTSANNLYNFRTDKFVTQSGAVTQGTTTTVNVMSITSTAGTARLRFMVSKELIDPMPGATLLIKWRSWLFENPVTLQFQRETPISQDITLPPIPYFGNPPILMNEVRGEFVYTI